MKMTPAQRQHMMLHDPVQRIIPKLAVPSIISMLITTIYNAADTFFVSQLDTAASGAVGVVFSVMAIIQAISFTLGMGTGTNLSQALGRGDPDEASRYASVGFFTALMTGVTIMVLGVLSLDWLVPILGATDDIFPYAKDYATYIFYAAPFMMGSFVLNNMLRFQGLATYGMVGITVGGVLNMILDPVFIFEAGTDIGLGFALPFGFGMKTAGAAVATAISQAVSFLILLLQSNLRSDTITVTPRHFRPTAHMYGRILNNGLPSLGRQGIASISTILLNNSVKFYVDPLMQTAAIAAMSIVSKIVMFVNSTVIGFGQGFQPVCSFNYGAGQYSRVRQAFWFCVKVTTVILLVLGFLAFLAATPILTAFRRDDPMAVEIGAFALRCHLSTIPLWGFIVMSNMFTQSIGFGVRSLIISISRQGLFLIPMLLLLPPLFSLTGVQIAQPIADVLALGLTILITQSILRQFARKEDAPLANPD
ncbi:MAG: MATE family efflux transporter [Clostridiales bacterium]|nr:MATE family efflux transporter [Clostridiales bacterium]